MQVPITVDYWHVIPVVILALSSVLCCSKSGLAFLVHRPRLVHFFIWRKRVIPQNHYALQSRDNRGAGGQKPPIA